MEVMEETNKVFVGILNLGSMIFLISEGVHFCYSSILKGQAEPVQADSLTRELLDTNKCYILDCGVEVFVWMGRNTSLDERKSASSAAEVSPSSFLSNLCA